MRWAGPLILVGAVITAHAGQVRTAAEAHLSAPSLSADALAVAAAVLVTVLLVQVAAAVRATARRVRRLPVRVRRRLAIGVLVPALVLTGFTGTANAGSPTGPSAGPAETALGPGPEGAKFLAGRPEASVISAFTHRPAQRPIRVYVGRDAAATVTARAGRAAAALEQAGGLNRATVLIDVPTGSGWVNPRAVTALERLTGGDLATVVLQYGNSPSWWAYLRGGDGVQASVRALTDAINARIARRPTAGRPRVLVYGESLGAWGGLRAYPDAGIAAHVDGALWVGVPGELPANPAGVGRARSLVLVHPDDPVPAWSGRLIVRPSRSWTRPWLPMASFWQATADVISAERTPAGFGHRYGPELAGAWSAVLGRPFHGRFSADSGPD